MKYTGFQSVASDYKDKSLDLNRLLIKNPPATFFFRNKSKNLVSQGILYGDLLIVDRSLKPVATDTVILDINGNFAVRKMPSLSKALPTSEVSVWGVVISVVHLTRGSV